MAKTQPDTAVNAANEAAEWMVKLQAARAVKEQEMAKPQAVRKVKREASKAVDVSAAAVAVS